MGYNIYAFPIQFIRDFFISALNGRLLQKNGLWLVGLGKRQPSIFSEEEL